MPMSEEAKARAKEKRAALKKIRDRRDELNSAAGVALINGEDLEPIRAELAELQEQEQALVKRRATWEDGKRTVRITDEYVAVAETNEHSGAAALYYGANTIVTTSTMAPDPKVLNEIISAYRRIVKVLTA